MAKIIPVVRDIPVNYLSRFITTEVFIKIMKTLKKSTEECHTFEALRDSLVQTMDNIIVQMEDALGDEAELEESLSRIGRK